MPLCHRPLVHADEVDSEDDEKLEEIRRANVLRAQREPWREKERDEEAALLQKEATKVWTVSGRSLVVLGRIH